LSPDQPAQVQSVFNFASAAMFLLTIYDSQYSARQPIIATHHYNRQHHLKTVFLYVFEKYNENVTQGM
jgi:hypothetical protein